MVFPRSVQHPCVANDTTILRLWRQERRQLQTELTELRSKQLCSEAINERELRAESYDDQS